jgi:hypothetical protein
MAVGFRIKDKGTCSVAGHTTPTACTTAGGTWSDGVVLISSETTTMMMHDTFTETGYGAKSKVYTDIFSGAVLYVTCTWALNHLAYTTYGDNTGYAGFIALWSSLIFSYSYSVDASGNYTLNYNCMINNTNIVVGVYDHIDFHLKVFVK